MNISDLSNKIFAELKGAGLRVRMFDYSGGETNNPSEATRFFVAKPNIMISIDADENQVVMCSGSGTKSAVVTKLRKLLRDISKEFLINYNTRVFGQYIQPKNFSPGASSVDALLEYTSMNSIVGQGQVNSYMVAKVVAGLEYNQPRTLEDIQQSIPGADLNEVQKALNRLVKDGKASVSTHSGQPLYTKAMDASASAIYEGFSKMFGSSKTSNQLLDSVTIKVRHRKPVDESVRGSRARQISAIFLEHNQERFRFPHNYLPSARAMAQHLRHGGAMTDSVGQHIIESTGNLLELRNFIKYVSRNNLINESSQDVVALVNESIKNTLQELKQISGTKSYRTAASRIATVEKDGRDIDVSDLQEMFTVKLFDQKYSNVLPIVKTMIEQRDQYRKVIAETVAQPVYITSDRISSTLMLEFSSPMAKVGHQLLEFSQRIVDNQEVATFVESVAKKLSAGKSADQFECEVVKTILENCQIVKQQPRDQTLKESAEISSFFDKYVYRML